MPELLMKPNNVHLMSDPESPDVSRDFVSEKISTQGKTKLFPEGPDIKCFQEP